MLFYFKPAIKHKSCTGFVSNDFLIFMKAKNLPPKQILETPAEAFRSIGFSNAKASYVHNVCRFFIENKITDAALHKMSNEEVIELLTQIKGVENGPLK